MDSPVTHYNSNKNKFCIPATPNLKRLGYGTGVGVFHIDRSPRNGLMSSPWALKKLMLKENNSTVARRLQNEAVLLKNLNHPNIVGFRAFSFTNDGRECLALEKCEVSLGDLKEEQVEIGPFPTVQIEKVAFQIAQALDYLHNTAYILHGDIKSHNVLIKGDFDVVKLCDFGVSLPLKRDGTFNKEIAHKDATYIGTQLWNAPEVYEHKTHPLIITDKADIFSYALMLWEMLTLSTPHMHLLSNEYFESSCDDSGSFNEEEMEETLSHLIGTRPTVPEFVTENETNKNIIDLFMKCTESDYKIRFSARDVVQFLCNMQTHS